MEPTLSVSELTDEIREVVSEAFRTFWVQGEVRRPNASQRGHLYFELVEKGSGDQILGKVDGVIWRTDHQRIRRMLASGGQQIADGQQIRCLGQLDFYGPGGRLQLVVREVDPLFTLGQMELRRRETMAALAAADLLQRNQGLQLPELPLRVGLITSENSAAYHDFLSGIASSGYGFQVLFVHAAMQGAMAERQVASALSLLASEPLDAIALVRGGGSRSDLAAFDSRKIAEAVARCTKPVLCGLGHEVDRSIADLVCHTSLKTPTMVAEFLSGLVQEQDLRWRAARQSIAVSAKRQLDLAIAQLARTELLPLAAKRRVAMSRQAIDGTAQRLQLIARGELTESGHRLDHIARRLGDSAQLFLQRQQPLGERMARRIATAAKARLREQSAILDGIDRLCHGLAPERTLERGFSLTRQGDELVTHHDQVRSGDLLTTRLANGVVYSRVEES